MYQLPDCSNKPPSTQSRAVNVTTFYGANFENPIEAKEVRPREKYFTRKELPHRLNNLLGPTQVWEVFQKQNDALEFAKTKRCGVMTFAFQQWDGIRLFLVAHPQIFWHYDVQKPVSQRCSYEIIPESCASKVYFDLEFDVEVNPNIKGPTAVSTFISFVGYSLSTLLNIKVSIEDVLDLDSSTDQKFSRHLIFVSDSYVFCDNKNVGEFVHYICKKLKLYLHFCNETVSPSKSNLESADCTCCELHESKTRFCIKDIGLPREKLQELVVLDRKGKKRLICDEAVYTKNRHFRLYQNTKWNKHSPLVLSKENRYKHKLKPNEKIRADKPIVDEFLFLDSLISNVGFQQINGNHIKILHFTRPTPFSKKSASTLNLSPHFDDKSRNQFNLNEPSPYPEVDKFINTVVLPGRIFRSVFFSTSSTVVYDIIGNRFCQNIERQHRSNNVKYIVNLDNYTYYQKCHDPDCSTFRSIPVALPPELRFKLEDLIDNSDISDMELVEVANIVEDLSAEN